MRFKVLRDVERGERKRLRRFWYKRGTHCIWCGRSVSYRTGGNRPKRATREHLMPKSLGGSTGNSNVVVACRSCNNARRSDTDWVPFDDGSEMPPRQREQVEKVKRGAA